MYYRVKRKYSKRTETWSVVTVKVEKSYDYIPDLQKSILQEYVDDKKPLKRKRTLDVDDPRRISKTLAKQPPPPTTELLETKRSRFPPLDISQPQEEGVEERRPWDDDLPDLD